MQRLLVLVLLAFEAARRVEHGTTTIVNTVANPSPTGMVTAIDTKNAS